VKHEQFHLHDSVRFPQKFAFLMDFSVCPTHLM
jgi:hypothetical protein